MQSSIQPGRHHRLSRRCRSGATRGSRYGSAEEPRFGATRSTGNRRTARNPRFRATWKLVDCRSQGRMSGATWRCNQGKTGWCVIRGNSDIYQPVPEDSEFGATWTTNRRRYRKARTRGNSRIGKSATPKNARVGATRRSIAGKAGDAGRGATQVLHRGRCRRRREPLGKPSTLLKPATPKACEARGNLSGPSPAQPKV